jgi:site-specific DNA recombinase
MKIAFYARVSTLRQQQAQTIEQQIERLHAAVATHEDWHLKEEHIFRDDGYSGAKLNRPGLDRLRDLAAVAAFELVLITDPDRLARKYVHQVLLVEELGALGCTIHFVDRPMSDNPHDQLLLQIRGAVAEYERTLIVDRMRRGRQAKLRSGTLLPWTTAPYGYLLDSERPRDPSRVGIDPVKSAVVKQIFAWYTDPQSRISLYTVAGRLNEEKIPPPRGGLRWHVASVRGILRSSAYAGTTYGYKVRSIPARKRQSALKPIGSGVSRECRPSEEWIAVSVPAIVSRQDFEETQTRLETNKQMSRRNNHTREYLLRGLVSCGKCRRSFSGRFMERGYPYYVCTGRTDRLGVAKEKRCTARYVPAGAGLAGSLEHGCSAGFDCP